MVLGAPFLFLFSLIALQFKAIGPAVILIGTVLAVAVWWKPYWAAMGLIVGGSVHQFAMLLLLHFSHTVAVVKAAQLWKEAVVLLLLALVIDRAFRARTGPKINLVDLAIIMYFTYGLVYLAFPSALEEASGLVPKVFGLRLDAFALLAYFVGRRSP